MLVMSLCFGGSPSAMHGSYKKTHAHTVISDQNQNHKTNDKSLSWNKTLETGELLT